MSSTAIDRATESARFVSETFRQLFDRVDLWCDAVQQFIREAGGTVSREGIDARIESLVTADLAAPGSLVIGAGFVAAPAFIADAPWHLAWWLGAANTFGLSGSVPTVRRLVAEEDPSSLAFRDYTALEWWTVPLQTGAAHVTGPYVDYLCTDDYTITLTVPVEIEGEMVGVVGCDLYVADVERILLPHLRGVAAAATIVNTSGRILVSSDPKLATGALLRGVAEPSMSMSCEGTNFVLVTRE